MQVLLHVFFFLGRCNRVTTRATLIFAAFFTLGLFHSQTSLSHPSLFRQALAYWVGTLLDFYLASSLSLKGSKGQSPPSPLSSVSVCGSSLQLPKSTKWLYNVYPNFCLHVNYVYKGLGIDDMFALVAALENLTEEEMLLPLEERMGLVFIACT